MIPAVFVHCVVASVLGFFLFSSSLYVSFHDIRTCPGASLIPSVPAYSGMAGLWLCSDFVVVVVWLCWCVVWESAHLDVVLLLLLPPVHSAYFSGMPQPM
jgi:hypothetical protein